MVELVDELRALPESPEIDFMIKEALAGEYHDYKNVKYVCGKMESSTRLRKLGYPELALRIEQGEFDEPADYQDTQRMAQGIDEVETDPERAKALKSILGLNTQTH